MESLVRGQGEPEPLILQITFVIAGMWEEIDHTECKAEKEMESSLAL